MNELIGLSVRRIKELLKSKKVSARELTDAHLSHIKKHDGDTGAFVCLTEELAVRQADKIDALIAAGGELPLLGGVPIALKDNMCLPGYPTTCASKILHGFVAPYTATAVERLFEAGAVCLGKTNMDEFAMGSSTENSSIKRTLNPWNKQYVPGGSSGGSAVSVAAGFAACALGSDTGGSVRQPASFCGVVGMKPTYGVVSRYGLVAFASSLDQIGPFGRCVEDVAITLSAIAGHDQRDSTSLAHPWPDNDGGDLLSRLGQPPDALMKDVRIGVIKELTGDGIDPDVGAVLAAAVKSYERLGASVEEVSIPHVKYALPVYYIIANAEASANLARFDGVRYGYRAEADDLLAMYMQTRQDGFGAEVKRRIMLGTYVLSSGYYDAYYKKAQQVRRLLKQDFDAIFARFDCVVCPTSPTAPFKFDEKTGDPMSMYLSDIASIPANLAGLPGISVPCGFSRDGLPIGMQLLGKPLADGRILAFASAYERSNDFSSKKVPLLSGN